MIWGDSALFFVNKIFRRTQKVVFHSLFNRIFPKLFVNGKQAQLLALCGRFLDVVKLK